MIVEILLFLFLLNVKHLFVDFYLQDELMVKGKAIYGDWDGILHSVQHFLGTWVVTLAFVHFVVPELLLGASLLFIMSIVFGIPALDGIIHYHIDWLKMQMERDVKKKEFWTALGCDQFLHQSTYIVLAMILFL